MRTIKFRGQKTTNEVWVYGSLVYSNDLYAAIYYQVGNGSVKQMEWVYVKPDTIGQFTGLHDKNGKEIYEGDIVRCNEFVYEVVYESKRFASFALRRDKDMYDHYFGEAMECDACEVIGNIHDNPKLLENEKD